MKFLNYDNVLCLSPHPDDVELSMSGTIKKFSDTRFDIFCLSQGTSTDNSSTFLRRYEVEHFWKFFDAKNVTLRFSEHKSMDGMNPAQLITYIENETIKKNGYQAIFGPSFEDSHFEHRLVNETLQSLARNKTLSLFEYRCISSLHGWSPNLFVDIDEFCAQKINALQTCFKTQMDSYYFKTENLELFHDDFLSNKKIIAKREFFKIKTTYL